MRTKKELENGRYVDIIFLKYKADPIQNITSSENTFFINNIICTEKLSAQLVKK